MLRILSFTVILLSGIAARGQITNPSWTIFNVDAPELVREYDIIELTLYAMPLPSQVNFTHPEELLMLSYNWPYATFLAGEEGYWPIQVTAEINGSSYVKTVWVLVDDTAIGDYSPK